MGRIVSPPLTRHDSATLMSRVWLSCLVASITQSCCWTKSKLAAMSPQLGVHHRGHNQPSAVPTIHATGSLRITGYTTVFDAAIPTSAASLAEIELADLLFWTRILHLLQKTLNYSTHSNPDTPMLSSNAYLQLFVLAVAGA